MKPFFCKNHSFIGKHPSFIFLYTLKPKLFPSLSSSSGEDISSQLYVLNKDDTSKKGVKQRKLQIFVKENRMTMKMEKSRKQEKNEVEEGKGVRVAGHTPPVGKCVGYIYGAVWVNLKKANSYLNN